MSDIGGLILSLRQSPYNRDIVAEMLSRELAYLKPFMSEVEEKGLQDAPAIASFYQEMRADVDKIEAALAEYTPALPGMEDML